MKYSPIHWLMQDSWNFGWLCFFFLVKTGHKRETLTFLYSLKGVLEWKKRKRDSSLGNKFCDHFDVARLAPHVANIYLFRSSIPVSWEFRVLPSGKRSPSRWRCSTILKYNSLTNVHSTYQIFHNREFMQLGLTRITRLDRTVTINNISSWTKAFQKNFYTGIMTQFYFWITFRHSQCRIMIDILSCCLFFVLF